jgi:hypothetical protein
LSGVIGRAFEGGTMVYGKAGVVAARFSIGECTYHEGTFVIFRMNLAGWQQARETFHRPLPVGDTGRSETRAVLRITRFGDQASNPAIAGRPDYRCNRRAVGWLAEVKPRGKRRLGKPSPTTNWKRSHGITSSKNNCRSIYIAGDADM